MALTYEKVISVISRPPDMRKDFEVNNLLSWFRKKSDLFRNLKTELLFDIIKHLQLEKKKRDDIVIRQGDKGDCMYILLRGQVTIFILDAAKLEAEEDNKQPVQVKPGESIRSQLGLFICSLGAGATFGEVALFSDDCIRTASIISDDNSDLIVVDRELYNRSVKSVLQKEFEDKSNFIATSPYFHNWPPKYKKQLAMALVKESVPYENTLVRQGDPVSGIFFILTGEVKLLSDPTQHEQQYQKFGTFPKVRLKEEDEEEFNEVNELLKQMSVKGHRPDEPELPKYRRKQRKNVLELCLLGMNESVGDVEVLLDMETYMQTAVCTQRTEVLLLEMKHYERLLVKRNPRSIDNMKAGLELKLTSRISSHIARQVPLLNLLSNKVLEYLEQREQANIARSKAKDAKNGGGKGAAAAGKKGSYGFIPAKGPLIDMHGPGTVFHRIRKREQAKAKQQARYSSNANGGGGGGSPPLNRADQERGSADGKNSAAAELTPAQIDPVLDNLEQRMREWLVNEKGTRGKIQPKYQVYDMQTGVREKPTSARTDSAKSRSRPTSNRPKSVKRPKSVSKRSVQNSSRLTVASLPDDRRSAASSGDDERMPASTGPDVYNGHAFSVSKRSVQNSSRLTVASLPDDRRSAASSGDDERMPASTGPDVYNGHAFV